MGNTSPLDAKPARTFNFLPNAAAYFCSIYPRRDSFICKLPGQDKWRTWTGPLGDHQILGVIADGGRGLLRGCHWGEQTRFAVLDIDTGSQYHNAENLVAIAQQLRSIGLNFVLYRSSENGGWHGYIPFTQWEKSSEIEDTLKRWLKALGYELKGGQLEVFPSGNALRLPLQPGFAWLDQEGNLIRRREDIGQEEALNYFLSDLQTHAADWGEAKERIESQVAICVQASPAAAGSAGDGHEERLGIGGFEHLFSRGCIKKVWEDGRKFWQEGLKKAGQRHEAILAIGHYLWYGDEENGVTAIPGGRNDEYRAALIEAWLKEKHNGFCNHINRSDWDRVREDVRRAVIWRKRADQVREPYPLTPRLLKRLVGIYKKTGRIWSIPQFEKANQDRKIEARDRIAEAIKELRDQGQLITVAEVARQAKAHWKTVKKNWDLLALVFVPTLEEKDLLKTETNSNPLTCSARVISPGGLAPSGGVSTSFFFPVQILENENSVLESFIESENQSLSLPGESRDWEFVLGASSEELAPIYKTPPLLSCLAEEPTTCTQGQDFRRNPQGLVLTLGASGIQAVLQEGAGGSGQSGNLQRDSGVNSGLLLGFGTFRYGKQHVPSGGWTENAVLAGCLRIVRYGLECGLNARIPRVAAISGDRLGITPLCVEKVPTRNHKAGRLFTVFRYGYVRGPPKRIHAWQAILANHGTVNGAGCTKSVCAKNAHRVSGYAICMHAIAEERSRRRWNNESCKQRNRSGATPLPEGREATVR